MVKILHSIKRGYHMGSYHTRFKIRILACCGPVVIRDQKKKCSRLEEKFLLIVDCWDPNPQLSGQLLMAVSQNLRKIKCHYLINLNFCVKYGPIPLIWLVINPTIVNSSIEVHSNPFNSFSPLAPSCLWIPACVSDGRIGPSTTKGRFSEGYAEPT